MNDYIRNRQYNTDVGDLLLHVLCNSYKVTATVYQCHHGAVTTTVQELRHATVEGINVSLALVGQGAGAHYSAVLPAVSIGTGGYNELEDIMPLPKA